MSKKPSSMGAPDVPPPPPPSNRKKNSGRRGWRVLDVVSGTGATPAPVADTTKPTTDRLIGAPTVPPPKAPSKSAAKAKRTAASRAAAAAAVSTAAPLCNVPLNVDLLTPVVALDCEMVGVGEHGKHQDLARLSLVNATGAIVIDMYVLPENPVTRYMPGLNGITAKHMAIAMPYRDIEQLMYNVLENRTVVGHTIDCDFRALFGRDRRARPKMIVEDVGNCPHLRSLVNILLPDGTLKRASLRELSDRVLGKSIQNGVHSSVEDARAALELYEVSRRWYDELAAPAAAEAAAPPKTN